MIIHTNGIAKSHDMSKQESKILVSNTSLFTRILILVTTNKKLSSNALPQIRSCSDRTLISCFSALSILFTWRSLMIYCCHFLYWWVKLNTIFKIGKVDIVMISVNVYLENRPATNGQPIKSSHICKKSNLCSDQVCSKLVPSWTMRGVGNRPL
jgi:hypothetical protein